MSTVTFPWKHNGLYDSKGKIRVFLLQEMSFVIVALLVGVIKYGHYTAQTHETLLNSTAKNKAVLILGRYRSGNEYVAFVTS